MKNKAFTLLELLVVIGIIGVMIALATVAYSSTQKSGRDSRRKQDMISMQNALEQYYSANSFQYPNGVCSSASTYLKSSWPTDPTNVAPYQYALYESCSSASYCVCAQMENGTTGNSGAANCTSFNVSPKTHYCVGNLQ